MMQKKGNKSIRYLFYEFFLSGLLISVGGCSSTLEVTIVVPQEPAIELEPGDSAPIEAQVTSGEAVRFEWTAECLQADNEQCQTVFRNRDGLTNFVTAPNRPGEQIIVSVVAVNDQGVRSERDTKTVKVVTSTGTGPSKELLSAKDPGALVINAPTEDAKVDRLITVSGSGPGTVQQGGTSLYILVSPQEDLYHYVQSLPRTEQDGTWKAQPVYIGRPDQDQGKLFDVCAVLTNEQLKPEQILSTFPSGSSDCITVERK